jgi:subtilisin family serine protease
MPRPEPRSRAEMSGAGIDRSGEQAAGAFLVLLDEDEITSGISALRSGAGIAQPEHVAGSDADVGAAELAAAESVVFDELSVAVVRADPDQRPALYASADASPAVLALEPERVVYAIRGLAVSEDYLRGYRDAVDHLVGRVLPEGTSALPGGVAAQAFDETLATWGLQATRVLESRRTGKGVKLAVLDTGVDLTHPDLVGRALTSKSFVAGEDVQDGHGHGTHCIGTAAGTKTPAALPRYGVAHDAEIFVGKVLSNAGRGADRGILAGINWAVANGCRVVSMSLGAPVQAGAPFSQVFERAAQRALRRGTVIVAAAGNDSDRPVTIAPVSHPANCPSILAVGALDDEMQVAWFSNSGLNPQGGQVDLAGPGVDVYSSWPMPLGNRRLNGTSMATPHVAGVIALLAEENPAATAAELKALLLGRARRLPLSSADVGAGLVQAP